MVYRLRAWLMGFFLLCGTAAGMAAPIIQSAATSLDHFSSNALQALYDLSLVTGVILLLYASDRFKKNKNSPQAASFSGALIYAVFGIGLIVVYFVV